MIPFIVSAMSITLFSCIMLSLISVDDSVIAEIEEVDSRFASTIHSKSRRRNESNSSLRFIYSSSLTVPSAALLSDRSVAAEESSTHSR